MINEKATFNRYGYYSTYLSSDSCLNVIMVCECCGKDCIRVRNVSDMPCFCSSGCRESMSYKHVADPHRENMVVIPEYIGGIKKYTCEWCGVEYERQSSSEKKHCFCSVACGYAYRSKHRVGKNSANWRGGKVELICEQCGCTYQVSPGEVCTRQFCSSKCFDIWRSINCIGERASQWAGGGTRKVCEVCGSEYYVDAYRVDITRFCSNECRGKWQSINHRGENNPSWNGGTSYGKYCEKFSKEFKKEVRAKYDNKCYLCPKTEEQNGRKMSVHHVSYLKECLCDGVECDFVPLCVGCHSKTNHNRFFWQTLITYSLAYEEDYYAIPIPNLLLCLPL